LAFAHAVVDQRSLNQEIRDQIRTQSQTSKKKWLNILKCSYGLNLSQEVERCETNVDIAELDDTYINPTETLPIPPPPCVIRMKW